MPQGVSALLANLKRSSKQDDIPGAVISTLDELCPLCTRKMKLYRPCCGSPSGYKGCSCGFKVNITDSGV